MSNILHTYVPKVKYSKIQGKPYVTVSAKGISNGLSDTYNDGADFGPDTMLNATSPNQYGPPYSNTWGIQEAVNYIAANGGGTVILKAGTYIWGASTQSVNVKPGVTIMGEGIDATIIQVENSSVQTTIPFGLNSYTRISGISFIMSYNNNPNYTPSAIIIGPPTSHVEIDHCSFDQQAVAWYIQFLATFNSSSPPTGYITDVRIHDNIIHGNTPNGGSEAIIVSNADGVEIYDNYFYNDTTTTNTDNSLLAVYDYSRNVSVHDNYFYFGATNGGPVVYFSDALNCEFVNNIIYSTIQNSSAPVLGVFNSTQHLKISNNIVYGTNFGVNLNTFAAFVSFGLLSSASGAVQNGAGGPDGNVSQNAGWNDFITIENNVVIGLNAVFGTSFNGYQNFTFLKVEGNVWGTLRGDGIPSGSIMSQNWGTIIYRNNIQISDLLIGPGAIGNFSPWFWLGGTSSYVIENAIIEDNRFPYATNEPSSPSSSQLNNVTLQYITNLIFRNNLLGGSGQNSVGITNYLNVSNVSQAVIEDNWAIDKSPNVPLLSTVVNGPTAGTVYVEEVNYRSNYKKAIFNFNGYENDTTTNQTINYPLPFSTTAAITANNTGLTISASTSGITITAPNSTTTYSGIVIVEGY
ncbi:MAG: hypothetical protein RXR31_07960 [Thermoproteota archaeon]